LSTNSSRPTGPLALNSPPLALNSPPLDLNSPPLALNSPPLALNAPPLDLNSPPLALHAPPSPHLQVFISASQHRSVQEGQIPVRLLEDASHFNCTARPRPPPPPPPETSTALVDTSQQRGGGWGWGGVGGGDAESAPFEGSPTGGGGRGAPLLVPDVCAAGLVHIAVSDFTSSFVNLPALS
jgi:hypothetical protein